MKKFMKYTAIIGGVFFLLGLFMAGIGYLGGGVKTIQNQYASVSGFLDDILHLDSRIQINDKEIYLWGGDNNIFDKEKEKYGEGTHEFLDMTAENLDIQVGLGEVHVLYHEKDSVILEIGKYGKMQCFLEEDTLKIKGFLSRSNTDEIMTVYLPKNSSYQDINVEVGAGVLNVQELTGKDVTLEVGMGTLEVSSLKADYLDAEVGMGSAYLRCSIEKEADMEVGMGEMVVEVIGEQDDFNYELSCGLGNLEVEGVYQIAGAGEKSIEKSARKELALEVAMGSGEISFVK